MNKAAEHRMELAVQPRARDIGMGFRYGESSITVHAWRSVLCRVGELRDNK